MSSTPLILYSGLAADEKVFAAQSRVFPQLVVPAWNIQPAETLDAYCERTAEALRTQESPVLGGASFGGIVALHMAKHLQPRALVLIGSIRSPSELPRYARWSRPLAPLTQLAPLRLIQRLARPRSQDGHLPGATHSMRQQFCDSDPAVIRWSIRCLLRWQQAPQIECPIFHIHGGRDRVLPARNTLPDKLIPEGGHVISVTHPKDVNEFIENVLDDN